MVYARPAASRIVCRRARRFFQDAARSRFRDHRRRNRKASGFSRMRNKTRLIIGRVLLRMARSLARAFYLTPQAP